MMFIWALNMHRITMGSDLNSGCVRLQSNDFSDETLSTNSDQLVHGGAGHVLGDDHGS